MLRRTPLSVLVGLLLVLSNTRPASAGPVGCQPGETEIAGVCSIAVNVSGNGGGGTPTTRKPRAADCKFYGEKIACRDGKAWWSNARQCYVAFMSPQPPKSDVKGHWFLPGDGHETCPVAATRVARWWPWDLPRGLATGGRGLG